MADAITLPGILDSPTSVFYKDRLRISPTNHLYSVTPVTSGYQVTIRFLSCSDEGQYMLGGELFTVFAKPEHWGVYYTIVTRLRGV